MTKNTETEKKIEELRRIRWVDKYHTFHKIVPGVEHTPEHEQNIIVEIIEECCTVLIRHYLGNKKPKVPTLRSVILQHMDMISYANVNTENRDFGYELCWYIAEKININIRKYTDTKVYGYWKVQDNHLKAVTKRGKKPPKKKK